MKCPHCLVAFNEETTRAEISIGEDQSSHWSIDSYLCPECKELSFYLNKKSKLLSIFSPRSELIYPRSMVRRIPKEVPPSVAEDFSEACRVLSDSPKASAALSRRCLQNLLRDAANTASKDLADQIQEVINSGKLPPHIAESIDAVRNIGNFGAHPLKSKNTGEILPVETGEAEWNLDVLEALFDFYYVQPSILKKKREALNAKLAEAGKPPMK